MLSKNQIKFIQSLQQKKYRNESGCFIAEGNKLVTDLAPAFECEWLVATDEWLSAHSDVKANLILSASKDELAKASGLTTPQDVIAIFKKPEYQFSPSDMKGKLTLASDHIQDPGNLGTIIRLADWFGIEQIICSTDTVDLYNPKTVQSTMGALARVKVHYLPLAEVLTQTQISVYGTFLDGEDMYKTDLAEEGIIIMGNEGNGISPEIETLVTKKLYIPNFPEGRETSESLNVAIATSIICAEFRRRMRK
ncbi:TrmH family RNA methyltransferase [Parabacteroides sp. FAFU027]|uniref:TrmH family RNA methyltransferase n=1 Tax=Parabacteroides sp. FAFU027 TaxID=2922715 RepID=UPI001FAEB650|nr:RNA methyltransferase [Parabacteroides sp. FAFU027]